MRLHLGSEYTYIYAHIYIIYTQIYVHIHNFTLKKEKHPAICDNMGEIVGAL